MSAAVPTRTRMVNLPHGAGAVRVVTSSLFGASTGAHASAYGTGGQQYDAAATATDIDYGSPRTGVLEDLHFTGSLRQIALGRFRRECRNNPYLAGLSAKYPEAVGTSSLRSRTDSPAYNAAKDLFWYRWSKHACVDGWTLRRAERVGLIEDLYAGEMFVLLLRSGQIQLLASEFCGSPHGGSRFGDDEINGIVYDANHRPVAYRFGRLTREGRVQFTGRDDELVAARHVIHDFDPDRLLLGRGLPRLLPSLHTFRSLYEITRAKTKQIKDANSLSGFIKAGAGGSAQDLLRGLYPKAAAVDDEGTATTAAETTDAAADPVGSSAGAPEIFELRPGLFLGLNAGEEAQLMKTEYEATDYKELIMVMLHAGSSPAGLPVELWFSGLGDVNYSGFKGLGTQWRSRREDICAGRTEKFLEPLQAWRCELAELKRELPRNPDGPAGAENVEWGWKRSAVLDDEKAAKSNQVALQSGEKSHADVWEENGQFPEEVLAKRRQLWIKLQVAAGQLDAAGDHAAEKVPEEFLLYNRLPGGAGPGANSPAPQPSNSKKDDDAPDDDS